MNPLHQRILDLYDAEVAKHPEGIKVSDARDNCLPQIEDWLVDEPRDFGRESAMAWSQAVAPTREARSRAIKRDLEYICDYFINSDEAALIPDSRMDLAIRLGEADGTDKTLRYWTTEDFIALSAFRRQRADEAIEAAEALHDVVARVVTRMRRVGAARFGDVDWRTA